MLERLFFRAFFAALVKRGFTVVAWRSDETSARFRRAYEYLREQRSRGPDLARLVSRLGPDPVSGSHPAFEANLLQMQPGDVTAPNPEYAGVRLLATPLDAERLSRDLPDDIRGVLDGAADAFVKPTSAGCGENAEGTGTVRNAAAAS